MDQPRRKRLLRFVTGSGGVPAGGFARLPGNDGKTCRFTLQPVELPGPGVPGGGVPLPRAHTCFNRLDLPLYKSKEQLAKVLGEVIDVDLAITGFGMD